MFQHPWQQAAAQYAPIFVLALYGVLLGLIRLAGTRWRWTAWLRRGRRKIDLAALLVAVAGLLPDVFDGTLRAGAVATVFSTWFLARMLPGGTVPAADAAPAADEAVPTADAAPAADEATA